MDETTEPLVVGVRFSKVGKIYHFVADMVTDIKIGDNVVVETSRGWQLGQVAQVIPDPEPPPEGWKPIDRRATPRDLLLRQMWQMKESEVVSSSRARSVDLNLVGIKIVSAEYSFDGSRLTIFFSSETEEKYELKSLRSDMQKLFAPSQVEMRQIGPRDVAKTVCGMGACGLETRCCCLFLTEFSSISIRMAKEQGISLTPTEITGMCGRLRCCLIYEYDTYTEARAKLPKRNKRVRTPQGDGKVVDVVPLRGSVIVDLPEVGYREFTGAEIQQLDAAGEPIGPAPEPPFHGTEQPSTMDQAITGEKSERPFVVGPGEHPGSPWDNPPSEEQPRSMPRPERPQNQRPASQRRGGRDGSPAQGGGQSGSPSEGGTRDRGPRRGGPNAGGTHTGGPHSSGPQGGKDPKREGRSQGPRGQGQAPERTPRPPRNESEPGGGSAGTPGSGSASSGGSGSRQNPSGPKNNNRDQHRRNRGRRRDSSDTDNHA